MRIRTGVQTCALPISPVQSPSGQPETVGAQSQAAASAAGTSSTAQTYSREDVLAKAENVFGRGAEGLAGIIENIVKDNGEPNGYIVGREAGGALIDRKSTRLNSSH